jgi:hypothetical protein
MTLQPAQLDYATGAHTRRRKVRRRLAAIALMWVVVAAGWWRGPVVYRRLLREYWQHQVQSYVAPPDRVVYEEDPGRWPALLARDGYQKFSTSSPGWNDFVGYMAEPVTKLAEAGQLRLGGTALFAHARRTPSGQERLVVVWMAYNSVRPNAQGATPDNQVRFDLCTSVVSRASQMIKEGLPSPWIAPQEVAENRQSTLYARIFAGQIDPHDDAHFTIPFEIGEYSDVIDGYLRDDDGVLLRPHKLDHPLNPK